MAQSYRSNFIDGAQAMYRNIYCEKTFSSWDFAVTEESARKSKHEASGSQLKVDVINRIAAILFLEGKSYFLGNIVWNSIFLCSLLCSL